MIKNQFLYKYAVIIVNYNGGHETKRFIDQFLAWNLDTFLLFLIDNKSPNGDAKYFSKLYYDSKSIIVVESSYNGGYSQGNNIGLNICLDLGINFAIVTNSDVVIEKENLLYLLTFLEQHPDVLVTTPKIVNSFNKTVSFPLLKEPSFLAYFLSFKDYSYSLLINAKSPQLVYSFSGCCFGVNINNFKTIGFFDPKVFLYHEELIISSKAKQFKVPIYYLPYISIVHQQGHTTGKNNAFIDTEVIISGLYYWKIYRKKGNFIIFFYYILYTIKFLLKSIKRRDKFTLIIENLKTIKTRFFNI
jgi:GT2 family glycosyltransferase